MTRCVLVRAEVVIVRHIPLILAALVWLGACGGESPARLPLPDQGPRLPPDGPTPPDAPPETPTLTVRSAARGGADETVEAIVYGDPFHLVLEHLAPGTQVTVTARKRDGVSSTQAWESRARFEVPPSGVVDTATAAATAGTYEGVDLDGLVWSMVRGSAPPGSAMQHYTLYFSVEDEEERLLAKAELRQLAVPTDVLRLEVNEDGLVGVLYLPASATPRSPVLALGGSEGGLFGGDWLASIAASQGHPALGLAYFGAPGLPPQLEHVPLEYVGKALSWLKRRTDLDTSRIAVMGASRGAELALLVGAKYPEVTAVVAWSPSAYVWSAVSGPEAAWTWGGAPLASVPESAAAKPGLLPAPDGSQAIALTPWFLEQLLHAPPSSVEAAAIEVEKIRGPVLLLGGDDDLLWPSCYFQEVMEKRLTASGHSTTHADASVCFPEAGHNLAFVGGPTTGAMWQRLGTRWYALGGTAAGIARAQREANVRLQEFLAQVLGRPE